MGKKATAVRAQLSLTCTGAVGLQTCLSSLAWEGKRKKKKGGVVLYFSWSSISGWDLLLASIIMSMMVITWPFPSKVFIFLSGKKFHIQWSFNTFWFNLLPELLTNGRYLIWVSVQVLWSYLHQLYKVIWQWESCFWNFCSLLRINAPSYLIFLTVLGFVLHYSLQNPY